MNEELLCSSQKNWLYLKHTEGDFKLKGLLNTMEILVVNKYKARQLLLLKSHELNDRPVSSSETTRKGKQQQIATKSPSRVRINLKDLPPKNYP